MKRPGKRYLDATKEIEPGRAHSPTEASDIIKRISKAKFDETIELHLRTGVDPRHADQMVRGVALLPHGLGKQVRVLVFVTPDNADIARQAGADYVGDDDLIRDVERGWADFDVGLAVPEMMSKIGKLGRVLGRKGLMPNPRTGTMVQARDLPRAVEEAKKGRVEYRTDRTAIIHAPVGKVSFPAEQILGNVAALIDAVVKSRPPGIKGTFIRSAYMTSTMGPSISLDVTGLLALKIE